MLWKRRRSLERDLHRELHSDLELEAAEQQEKGLSAEEARYAARRAFGNTSIVTEDLRAVWGWTWLEQITQDLSYALRAYARTPGFTAVAVITLALGIGATSAIFSIVDSLLLHPLPYPDANRLVVIWEKLARNPKAPPIFDSYRDFQVWKSKSTTFEELAPATWATGQQILTGAGKARNVLVMPVGIDFFKMLGIRPGLGRTFQPDDLNRGCTVVLSHRFWATAFANQRHTVGSQISLGQKTCTIIGVMPREFTFYPDVTPMWTLITTASEISRDPDNANVGVFGRLKPGVTLERAQRETEILYKNEHRSDKAGISRIPAVHSLAEQFAFLTGPNLRLSVLILLGAVFLVLLIACVNIANLLLGRSLQRQRELAVRAALGSGRARLLRQLLTEALLLSFTGAILGVGLATAAVHYFRSVHPIELPPGNQVSVNLFVLGFTVALAFITALAFGIAPAFYASRVDLIKALRASGRSSSGLTARLFGKCLVAAEVTLSLTLMVGAGLLIESVAQLSSVPLGFRTQGVATIPVELPKWSYATDVQRNAFYLKALAVGSTVPGVETVTFASTLPLNSGRWGGNALTVEGKPNISQAEAPRDVAQTSITPEYFRLMNVPLDRGRLFDDGDRAGTQAVAVVNQALAKKYFPHESPIGRRIQVGSSEKDAPWLNIVGVAANEKDRNFFHEMTWEEVPTVFRPLAQSPPSSGSLVFRAAANNIAGLGQAVQKQISKLDSSVPVGEIQTMDERLSRVLAYARFRAQVLGAFAGLALLLAAVGLYGVLSQLTAQRTQEFGVRMALGAQRRDVLGVVVRQALALTITGLAAGVLSSLILTRFLSSLLYGVKYTDPFTLAAVSFLLLVVASLATYVPARRAAKVDPMVALRYE